MHQLAIGELFALLKAYVDGLGRHATAHLSPADITWDDDVLVQPDIFVVPREDVRNSASALTG